MAGKLYGSIVSTASCFAVVALSFIPSSACGAEGIFADDFERADGPASGWTSFRGAWRLAGGRLEVTRLTTVEHWIWAGSPAVTIPANASSVSFTFDMEFLAPGTDPTVGRHGGFVFCADRPTQRSDPLFHGYFVDWIDRTADRGLRFTRVDGGQLVELVLGAPDSPAEPPRKWRVEVDQTNIRLFADDLLMIDLADATYRGGHFGFWTYAGGQLTASDNLVVEGDLEPLTACFTANPPGPAAGTPITFDASCSRVTPGGTILDFDWDFGDGQTASGAVVEHAYAFADNYTATLTISDDRGNSESSSTLIQVRGQCLPLADDFDRPEGPADGWTSFQGVWTITPDGRLNTIAAGTESWAWAGDPPCLASGDMVAEFDMTFNARPGDGVGRHAGAFFFATDPTVRWQTSGYDVWWIDRGSDFGISIRRWDAGAFTFLTPGTFALVPEPPQRWRIEVSGPKIRVLGDGEQYVEVIDETYRAGHFGFWAYSNGQDVLFDNLSIAGEPPPAVVACFEAPSVALRGQPVHFDASCSRAADPGTAVFAWDFGDGRTGSGPAPEHAFDAEGVYTVTLTLSDVGGNSDTSEALITVGEPLLPFADCFERPAGPVEGWRTFQGTWAIDDAGRAGATTPTTSTQADEHWIWAGDPPRLVQGDFTAEFGMEFIATPPDGVGRHAGIFFFAGAPGIRWGTTGYDVWWIDRVVDRGVSVRRWDNGTITFLSPGTFDIPAEPPATWRLEVEGTFIRVFGDGALLAEVEDATYRAGFFGLWAYSNGQDVRFDDLRIGQAALPDCGGPTGPRFVRGDADSSGLIDLADSIRTLSWLFLGGLDLECPVAADVDDDGVLSLTDAINTLSWLFLGGAAPPAPGPTDAAYPAANCGEDPTPGALDCPAAAAQCR